MTRTIPAAILAALTQPVVEPFYAVEMLFDSGPIWLWTGHGNRTIGGQTYTGTNKLMVIGGLEETADISPKQVTITLSAIDPVSLSLALQEPFQGRACRILFGVVNVDAFVVVFEGLMNTMPITDAADSATIGLTVDSKLILLDQARSHLRYTDASQQARWPGDTFFSYVADIQDRDFVLGRKR